jgi:hypothetical protein
MGAGGQEEGGEERGGFQDGSFVFKDFLGSHSRIHVFSDGSWGGDP